MVIKNIKSNEGSTMVEMAIIFPLIIAAVMTLIYLLINIYSAASLQSSLHLQVREKGATEKELVEISINDLSPNDRYRRKSESLHIDFDKYHDYYYAEKNKGYKGNSMIDSEIERLEFGRSYILDECAFYRKMK